MKSYSDPRHQNRIKLIQELFALSFKSVSHNPVNKTIFNIKNNLVEIDRLIEKSAPQFPLPNIAKIDVAILRLAIYEMLYEKAQPYKVIIDEAVELAKEFGGEGSSSFINGVLGNILNKLQKDQIGND